jgi:predicted NUDIX family phosphoesterase
VTLVEQVLVLPRDAVPGGTSFLGLRRAGPAELDDLKAAITAHGRWADRPAAEDDPSSKQIIPYVVVRDRTDDGELVFLTERTEAGGDPRLHLRASIGVGGHLNPVDHADPLAAGLRREWDEELATDWTPDFTLVGFLNDDRNSVGSVHLGVVFSVDAAGRPVAVREHEMLSGRLVPVGALRPAWDRLETWSQLVADALWGLAPG